MTQILMKHFSVSDKSIFIAALKESSHDHNIRSFYASYTNIKRMLPIDVYECEMVCVNRSKRFITVYHQEGNEVYVVNTFWMKPFSNVSIRVEGDFEKWYEAFLKSNEVKNYVVSTYSYQSKFKKNGEQGNLF